MSPTRHPPDELLLEHATGALPDAARLVVGLHVARCMACRKTLGLLDEVGGVFLEDAPPSPLARDSLQAALRRRDVTRAPEPLPSRRPVRWWGPGRRIRNLGATGQGWSAYLLEAPAGARIPVHRHRGQEFTCVLDGAVEDEAGRYAAGDFMEGSAGVHHLRVSEGASCRAVMATEGRMELIGWLRVAGQAWLR